MNRLALIVMIAIAAMIPLLACGAESARAEKPMFKGVELYSWKDEAGAWCYSLLPGTNRLKTQDEITSERTIIRNIDTLKKRLVMLAAGEHVSWFNPDKRDFAFPDTAVVADIVAYAKLADVTVSVPY